MGNHETPKVGVGVFIFNDKGQFLVGKRSQNVGHGKGQYSLPGGHMEIGETPEQSCEREVKEEVGVDIKVFDRFFIPYTNDIFELPDKHYITLFFVAYIKGGEVTNMEPEKCEGWEWHTDKTLPNPLFPPLDKLIKSPIFPDFMKTMANLMKRWEEDEEYAGK
jgi:8-oxo-dGTP diphosphatase